MYDFRQPVRENRGQGNCNNNNPHYRLNHSYGTGFPTGIQNHGEMETCHMSSRNEVSSNTCMQPNRCRAERNTCGNLSCGNEVRPDTCMQPRGWERNNCANAVGSNTYVQPQSCEEETRSSLSNGEYGCGECNVGAKSYGGVDEMTVAMAYVPWQKLDCIYDLEQAFCRGTLFPELDRPFKKGRCE